MNIVAVDIGNTNVAVGLFLDGKEDFIRSFPIDAQAELKACLIEAWEKMPALESSAAGKRNGVLVVSSVNPKGTERVRKMVKEGFREKIHVIGKDIPLPMPACVDKPDEVGTDRIVAAAAAYDVVEGPVVVADLGTAVTIDLVDDSGVFQGGVICPGFEISAQALNDNTAQLPKVTVRRPEGPYGKNTADAINCGLYYSVIGTLEEIIRRYAERIGRWPQTVITGSGARIIHEDCPFVDNYVPNLVIKGIVLAFMKYIEAKSEAV